MKTTEQASEILKQTQIFYISEFRAKEGWLSFMHKQGWKLHSINRLGCRYTFEQCPEEDWIYQLDFKNEATTDEDYIQMYADYGWEYVLRFRHWFYFRKKKTSGAEEDLSIFSDNDSRIAMCRQIIAHHLRLTIPFFIGILIFVGLIFFSPAGQIVFLRGAAIGALFGALLSACFIGNQLHLLRRLNRRLANPI